jgi:hypothetical protein
MSVTTVMASTWVALAPLVVRGLQAAARYSWWSLPSTGNSLDRARERGSHTLGGNRSPLPDPLVRPSRVEVAQRVFGEETASEDRETTSCSAASPPPVPETGRRAHAPG